MMKTTWYQMSSEWLLQNLWIIEVASILILLLFLNYLIKKILLKWKKKNEELDWAQILDYSFVSPARALLSVILISFALDLIGRRLQLGGIFHYIGPLRNVGIVICMAWFVLRWKRIFRLAAAVRKEKGKHAIDLVTIAVMERVYTIAVVVVSLLIIMQLFGLDIAPLLAFGGIGAAAIGFASKEVIANFFGGFMLYAIRPFSPNDFIDVPEKKISGAVEEIGWYITTVRDLQKKPIYVPNSIFLTEIVVNLSRITHRRLDEVIEIRPNDLSKIGVIVAAIEKILKANTNIDSTLPLHVYFKGFASQSLEIEVQAYFLSTRYEDFMPIKQQVLLEIASAIIACGAEISHRTTAVHII